MSDGAIPGTIRIRLGVLSVASLLVTVAALTTLVIVVAIQRADLLSVVALALAIIAFSAQLIIYVVQASESSSGTRRALGLHAELGALLSELRERTGQTQQMVNTINSRLLEAVIGKLQLSEGDDSPREFAERVAELYTEASQAAPPTATTSQPSAPQRSLQFPPPLPDAEARRINSYMSTWPSADEAAEVETALRELSEAELGRLHLFAKDLWNSSHNSPSFGPGLTALPQMVEKGLLEKIKGWKLATLSERGMKLGRVFTAVGAPPAWAKSLATIRDEVDRRENVPIDNRDIDA